MSLGTYQFTLVGPAGPLSTGLAKPIQLTLHLDGWRGAAFDARNITLIIRGSSVVATSRGATSSREAKAIYAAAALDAQARTVTAVMPLTGSTSYTGTWNTQSPEAQ